MACTVSTDGCFFGRASDWSCSEFDLGAPLSLILGELQRCPGPDCAGEVFVVDASETIRRGKTLPGWCDQCGTWWAKMVIHGTLEDA